MIWIRRLLVIALILVSCAYVLTFAMLNDDVADIHLVFARFQAVSIELAMVASFVIGGLAGLLVSSLMLLKMRRQHRKLLKKVQKPD